MRGTNSSFKNDSPKNDSSISLEAVTGESDDEEDGGSGRIVGNEGRPSSSQGAVIFELGSFVVVLGGTVWRGIKGTLVACSNCGMSADVASTEESVDAGVGNAISVE